MIAAHVSTRLNSEASSPRRLPVATSFRIEPLRFVLKLAFLAAALAASVIVVATARTFMVKGIFELAIGLLIAHATELVHQTLHKTATGVARWDQRLGRVLAWMSGTSFWLYSWFHLWHHRYNGTEMDAESFGYAYGAMQSPKRFVRVIALARHLSMASHYATVIGRTWLALRGRLAGALLRSNPAMKPVIARRIAHDYIVFAVIIGAAVVASIVFRTTLLIHIWLIPVLVAWGPAHALIELPEHWGCDRPEANSLRNTRSIRAGRFARWFTNNNCNHVGHHHDMSVPMERLPEYEAELMRRGIFRHYDESYATFYREFLRHIFLQPARRPQESVEPPVPAGEAQRLAPLDHMQMEDRMNGTTITPTSTSRLARLVAGITLALLAALATTGCGHGTDAPASPTATLVAPMPSMTGSASMAAVADQRMTATAIQPEAGLKSRLFCPPNLIGPCISNVIGVTQGYLASNPVNPTPDHRHAGIDFGGSYTVYAPVAGRVVTTGACGLVEIEDSRRIDNGVAPRHVMLHMKNIQVSGGQSVRVGTVLGVSSNVSYPAGGCVATGIHLHYEIRRNYAGTSAVGPTSCGSDRTCTTASLTYDPLGFPF